MREHDVWKPWLDRRSELARLGLGGEHLDELEDHLRCEVEAEVGADASAVEAAVAVAVERLGATNALATEYRKAHPPMTLIPKLLGVACSLGVVFFALGSSLDLSMLLDAPSVLLVGGFVAGGLCASFGPRRIARTVAVGLGAGEAPTLEDLEQLDAVSVRGQRLAWASGVVGFLAGLVATAANLSDPAQIGPAIALSLLSLLYGSLLAELGFGSLRAWIAGRVALGVQAARVLRR